MEANYSERIAKAVAHVESTSTVRSKEEFNAFINEFTKNKGPELVDPNQLQDLIDNYTDRFDRLKFLFLEQEAKEQFLRLVLEQNTKHVDRNEILKSVEEGEELKRILEQKKHQIDEVTSKIRTVASTNHDKLDKINALKIKNSDLVTDLETNSEKLKTLNDELNQLQSADPTIQRFEELREKLPDIDFDINVMSKEELAKKLEDLKEKKNRLQSNINLTKVEIEAEAERIDRQKKLNTRLVEERSKLDKLIESMKTVIGEDNEEVAANRQILMQNEEKLRVLSELWKKISHVSHFRFNDDENVIYLKYKNLPEHECIIKLTPDEKIESITYKLLDDLKLMGIKEASNAPEIRNPLLKASQLIYKSLSE